MAQTDVEIYFGRRGRRAVRLGSVSPRSVGLLFFFGDSSLVDSSNCGRRTADLRGKDHISASQNKPPIWKYVLLSYFTDAFIQSD